MINDTEVHRISCGMVNCYLLREAGRSILVDAGGAGDKDRIFRKAARRGVAPGDLQLILLTHNHADHIGAAAYYRSRGIPVGLHPADAPLPGQLRHRGPLGWLMARAARPQLLAQQPLEPDVPLADGLSLEPYGISGTVVALPGHTRGSVGVLLSDGRLVCGDVFLNVLRPGPTPIAEDFAVLAQTVAALERRDVTWVYPGHGKPFRWGDLA